MAQSWTRWPLGNLATPICPRTRPHQHPNFHFIPPSRSGNRLCRFSQPRHITLPPTLNFYRPAPPIEALRYRRSLPPCSRFHRLYNSAFQHGPAHRFRDYNSAGQRGRRPTNSPAATTWGSIPIRLALHTPPSWAPDREPRRRNGGVDGRNTSQRPASRQSCPRSAECRRSIQPGYLCPTPARRKYQELDEKSEGEDKGWWKRQ